MTRERAKELLPIIQAFAEGKTIQSNLDGVWKDNTEPDWTARGDSYRVKPETVELWVNVYPSGDSFVHPTEERARRECSGEGRTIRVREVIES